MQPLIVDVEGRVLRFDGTTPVRIGRSADAEVVLEAGSVSRVHAELRPVGDGWVLVDSGSQFGTFVDGVRVTEQPITGTTEIRCGAGAPGSRLTVSVGDGVLEDGPVGAGGTVADLAPPPPRVDDSPTSYFEPRPAAAPPPPPPGPPPAGPPPSGPPPMAPPAPPPPAPAAPAASRFAPPESARPAPGPSSPPPSVPPTGTVVRPPEAGGNAGGSDRPSGLQAAPAPPPSSADGFEQTQVLAGAPLAGPPGAPPMPPTGPDLMIVAEGTEHRFRHPAQISIGRRPDCTVVLTDPAASRLHGHVAATRTGWSYTNASQEGTFDDGKRVTSMEFDEATTLRLGHPVAGPELQLVPILAAQVEEKRIARKRLRRRFVVIGGAAAAVLLVLGLVFGVLALTGGDDEPVAGPGGGDGSTAPGGSSMEELTDDELSAAKSATVQILVETRLEDGTPVRYSGSGSIIDSSGLILTNAHVAAPSADGLEELYGDELPIVDPEFMLISLTGDDDTPAEPEYRARVVEADGSMDAAVIEIFATADGGDLEQDLELPTRPLGDSDEIDTGDDLTVLGFPGVSQSKALTVTTGVVSTFIDGPFGPRSVIDTDARIAPGNSGGMAIDNDANIIGIPTAVAFDQSTPIASGRIRPINVVADLIESAEEQTG